MNKYRICFICLGNICRSPMAEYIMKNKLRRENINNVLVASRGTSYEEQGNRMYLKAREVLADHDIDIGNHSAKCLERVDNLKYNHFICMEDRHVEVAKRILGKSANIYKLQDYDIEDPWYTDNFDKVYNEIEDGIDKLVKKIKEDVL